MSEKTRIKRKQRRYLPLWLEVLLHIVAIGIALVLFALPHHVLSYEKQGLGIEVSRSGVVSTNDTAVASDAAAVPAADVSAAADAEPAATAESAAATGDFSEKFADKFVSGAPQFTPTSYVSENINVNIQKCQTNDAVYYVADIYLRDISCLRRAFAQDRFGKGITESIEYVSARMNAVLTISGDYYATRDEGVVEVNGTVYLNSVLHNDICVLYWNGSMKCFSKSEFDCDREIANGAYQIWNFGPALLDDDGQPLTSFPGRYDDIIETNPRSVIGYYEPGHYCLITVEGRSEDSDGLTMSELAQVASDLGLTQAYNLDGGRTAKMYMNGALMNVPSEGGRDCSDYICIVDRIAE